MRRRRGYGGLALGMVITIVLIVIVIFRSGPRSTALRGAAQPAIRAIEQYAQQHGRYPATLAATGATGALTPYGRYHYQLLNDGADCSLSVGSDTRDGFVLTWDCATRLWSVNPRARIEPPAAAAVLSQPVPDSSPPRDSAPLV